MIKVISISTDRNIFKEGSAVRARQIEYGALFDELHIVVFTKLTSFLPTKIQIAPNVWVYGTHSLSKLLYITQAVRVVSRIVALHRLNPKNSVVTVQDPFETGIVGAKLKEKFSLPLHVQVHTDFVDPYFIKQSALNHLRLRIGKKILAKADAIRVVSQRIADRLSAFSLKPGVVPMVLPIFTDTKKIEGATITVDLKKKYPQFNFIILMASRLTKEKNVSFGIKVFQKLVSVYPQIGLVIVGAGPEKKGLVSLAKRLKISKSVVFEPWQEDLASYYKTANLFILTSNYEGYGLTLVEAIAAHCPVVSTDVGIASKLLEDGVISPICPVSDTACFFDMISRFIENPGIREHSAHESYDRLSRVIIPQKTKFLEKYKESIESAIISNQP